jgi:hypothetical protein
MGPLLRVFASSHLPWRLAIRCTIRPSAGDRVGNKRPTSMVGFTVLKLCSTRNDKAPQQV